MEQYTPTARKTRLWKDQPWNGEMLSWRCQQVWCLCCKCSSQISAYGREEKGAPMSTAPVSCGDCDGYGQNRQALREIKGGRCSLCRGVGRTGLFVPLGVVFSRLVATCAVRRTRPITGNSNTEQVLFFSKATERNGFKVPKDEMFGPGVHTTSDIEKTAIFTAQHETKRGFGVVFVLDFGRCKTHYALGCSKSHQPYCQCKRWLQENYESQEVPAGAGIKRTETVVSNARQIAILGVIMESIRPSPSDCRERGNARKDARGSQPGWSDANGARLKERATLESWNVPRISREVKFPRPLAERRRFTK